MDAAVTVPEGDAPRPKEGDSAVPEGDVPPSVKEENTDAVRAEGAPFLTLPTPVPNHNGDGLNVERVSADAALNVATDVLLKGAEQFDLLLQHCASSMS